MTSIYEQFAGLSDDDVSRLPLSPDIQQQIISRRQSQDPLVSGERGGPPADTQGVGPGESFGDWVGGILKGAHRTIQGSNKAGEQPASQQNAPRITRAPDEPDEPESEKRYALTNTDSALGQIERGGLIAERGYAQEAEAQGDEAREQERAFQSSEERTNRIAATIQATQMEKTKARYYADQKLQAYQQDASLMRQYPGMDLEDIKASQRRIGDLEDQIGAGPLNGAGRLQQMKGELQREQLKLRAAEEIDPDGGMSGNRKIAAAIAMGLGAFGASLARTPNYAMQIIQDEIGRKIAAQKDRFARVRNNADMLEDRGLKEHSLALGHFDDEISRYHAQEIAEWQNFQRMTMMIATRAKSAEAKARAQQMIGNSEMKIGEVRDKIYQAHEQLAIERLGKAGKAQPDAYAPIIANLKEMLALRNEFTPGNPANTMTTEGRNKKARMESLKLGIINAIASMKGGFRGKHAEMLEQLIGDPTGFGTQSEHMRTAIRIFEAERAAHLGQSAAPSSADEAAEYGGEKVE